MFSIFTVVSYWNLISLQLNNNPFLTVNNFKILTVLIYIFQFFLFQMSVYRQHTTLSRNILTAVLLNTI